MAKSIKFCLVNTLNQVGCVSKATIKSSTKQTSNGRGTTCFFCIFSSEMVKITFQSFKQVSIENFILRKLLLNSRHGAVCCLSRNSKVISYLLIKKTFKIISLLIFLISIFFWYKYFSYSALGVLIYKSSQFFILLNSLSSLPSDELQWKRAPTLPYIQTKSKEKSEPSSNFRGNTPNYKSERSSVRPIDPGFKNRELQSVDIQSDSSSSNSNEARI